MSPVINQEDNTKIDIKATTQLIQPKGKASAPMTKPESASSMATLNIEALPDAERTSVPTSGRSATVANARSHSHADSSKTTD